MTTRQHRTALSMLFIVGLFTFSIAADQIYELGVAHADAPALLDAGAGSGSSSLGSAIPTASDQLHNPVQSPAAAFDELKAAQKLGWACLVFAALVMLTKALIYAKTSLANMPLIGRLATWLAVGRRAIWLSGIGAIAAASYNALVAGGATMAVLYAAGATFLGLVHPFGTPPK